MNYSQIELLSFILWITHNFMEIPHTAIAQPFSPSCGGPSYTWKSPGTFDRVNVLLHTAHMLKSFELMDGVSTCSTDKNTVGWSCVDISIWIRCGTWWPASNSQLHRWTCPPATQDDTNHVRHWRRLVQAALLCDTRSMSCILTSVLHALITGRPVNFRTRPLHMGEANNPRHLTNPQ